MPDDLGLTGTDVVEAVAWGRAGPFDPAAAIPRVYGRVAVG